jgi:dihydroorotate dehydrogenase (NAD+) catalytic subunit
VSVGTVVFNDPNAPIRIQRELAQQLAAHGFSRLTEAISYAHRAPEADLGDFAEEDFEVE